MNVPIGTVGVDVNTDLLPALMLIKPVSALEGQLVVESSWMTCGADMFDEPDMSPKRSGQSAAMSVSVKSGSDRYMVWCVEMFE